jgi:lipopolysaccharide assembly outer membrane protein LptD (OstA)
VVADFAAVDLRSLVALAQNAELDTPGPGFQVRGERVQRTGVNTYSIENATFTTCRCPPGNERRPWQLEARKADVQIGGYATARDLWVRAFGVPVLHVPWLIYPVKTERQTGFLLPSVGNSARGGTEIETPFFIELGPQAGALLRPTYFSDRGLKTSLELEYVFGEEGEGKLGGAALPNDDGVDDNDPTTPFSQNRWAYWFEHRQPLGEGLRLGFDVHEVSDNEYPLDFDDIPGARSDRFLSSSGWATWGGRGGLFAALQAEVFDDLQSPNDLDRDDFLLQRLPQLDAAVLPRSIGGFPLRFGLDSRYTYFYQADHAERLRFPADLVEDDSDPLTPPVVSPAVTHLPVRGQFFDTGIDGLFDKEERSYRPRLPTPDPHEDTGATRSEGDGVFQEGELLADYGHRMDFYPHVSLPLQLGVLEMLPEVGLHETLYLPRLGNAEAREVFTGRLDLRTRLARTIPVGDQALRHVLEPRVTLAAVSAADPEENPLFVPAPGVLPRRLIEGDLRLLTRDPSDQIQDARLVVAQLGNRIFARPPVDGAAPRLLAEFRLGSSYDFVEDEIERYFAEGRFHPWRALQLHVNGGWDAEERSLEEVTAEFQWLPESRHALSLGYRYRRELARSFEEFRRDDDIFDKGDEDADRLAQVDLTAIFIASSRVELFATGFTSLEDSSVNGGEVGVLLISACRCWDLIASVEQRTRPDDTRFKLELRLSGLGRRPELPGELRRRRDDFVPGL